ncbi:hypothetical protein LEP1GSC068_4056 [Leptospira sp. Fiocruz LV3954]|nr:hypothetical protein LEP1GSC068_4056 [Leptospira sp. Fiocruz LV3954]EMI67930.1 hypothetical protein LEP1GSC076_1904 [Leptospira sp. Fiocruz LV4135]
MILKPINSQRGNLWKLPRFVTGDFAILLAFSPRVQIKMKTKYFTISEYSQIL